MGQSIQGIITDGGSGNPLSGAHIVIENSKYGTISDYRGSLPSLVFLRGNIPVKASFIGYETSINEIVVSEGFETVVDFRLKLKALPC
ncbi:MAG: carboxypeptidase-like regulatory domain-containing protein [Sphingobacterium sp.]|nr:carboxypeptidase-like regulatory domain-containing protein [Sphingobacterium sp.]